MYNHFQLGIKFLGYFFTASNGKGHGIHSPFVYAFVESVLLPSYKQNDLFMPIENTRRKYTKDTNRFIEVEDLGAGSFSNAGSKRSVAQIAKGAAKHPKFARLLHRMIDYYNISSVLELGTSLGLTTRYLAIAGNDVKVQTIEGAPGIADFTNQALTQEGFKNIEVLVGDFEQQLPLALANMNGKKLVFFDGNHQYEPTVNYFNQVLHSSTEYDILVFDDIHWSEEMEKAWAAVKQHPRVTLTIDLFFVGLVFMRKEQLVVQHFKLRY
jgi:predicted O-methyltransferase YrrM